jgi:hypothetical protein
MTRGWTSRARGIIHLNSPVNHVTATISANGTHVPITLPMSDVAALPSA